ncbi:sporulation inhibitor of replication protein SirA [Anoxybacillus sp. J5B_2022]|uniref:sporulation inhibitor of replication protein SirA n=1 Tax=Anoxybacillus sp. J5B_2022 TaxID=3003246 RepID=UPI002286803D|nr:sporulation inhibitor of replication protein SirA [Anoxybacillus sp. J5B_2022]MCZ0754142.1 sporulation inhibitor of replication protein SirA [Anoxybacillus sp. J5B_2022]
MARYWIYLFCDEVAYSYYHRPEKIVELLREYQYQTAPLKSIYHQQIEFITERISFSRLELGLNEHFSGKVEKNLERNMFVLKDEQMKEEALIIVQKRRLLLVSEHAALTERIFQAFSHISPFFLAVDIHFHHHQWLLPVANERKFA